ncbi:MAG: hydantoinase B/oxoprolinase family protein, partial [Myxococcota bacterium]
LLRSLPDGRFEAEDLLDDDGLGARDIPIRAALTIAGDEAVVDLTGSSVQVEGPLNAVTAVTVSAILYALRCIAPEGAPASTGLLRPIRVVAPEASIVNARFPAPVAGGNVETSQRIVDVLLQALAQVLPERIPACSQGTMNNVAMGGDDPEPWAYYETLGGGTGGGPGFQGESALHSHMTNTLNTPVEALEHACPLRVETMRIRRGSGGSGRWRGGEGLERAYRVLAPTEVTLLSERRRQGPPGMAGGEPGLAGENLLLRGDEKIDLPGKVTLQALPGDLLVIRTPGGGGHGRA